MMTIDKDMLAEITRFIYQASSSNTLVGCIQDKRQMFDGESYLTGALIFCTGCRREGKDNELDVKYNVLMHPSTDFDEEELLSAVIDLTQIPAGVSVTFTEIESPVIGDVDDVKSVMHRHLLMVKEPDKYVH